MVEEQTSPQHPIRPEKKQLVVSPRSYNTAIFNLLLLTLISLGFFIHGGVSGAFGTILFISLITALFLFNIIPVVGVLLQVYIGWVYALPSFSNFVGYSLTYFELSIFVISVLMSVVITVIHANRVLRLQ